MTDMMTLTSDLPIGLRRVLRDTFKCQICHSVPVKPPVIVTKCCKKSLGCQAILSINMVSLQPLSARQIGHVLVIASVTEYTRSGAEE